jgi:hypothetical protein
MRNFKNLFLGLAVLFLLTACGPSRYTNSSVNLSSIPEYAFIQPYANITLYGDDGKGYYDEESSHTSARVISWR